MTNEDIAKAILALDRWFESQGIEDKYAAIILANLEALHMARNFSPDSATMMGEHFKRLFDGALGQMIKQAGNSDEEKRPN